MRFWRRRAEAPAGYVYMTRVIPPRFLSVNLDAIRGDVDTSLGASSIKEAREMQTRWHYCKFCGRDQRR